MAPLPLKPSAEVTCILNAAAGANELEAAGQQLSRIAAVYGAKARVVLAHGGTELSSLTATALNENSQPIVAGGGDGTLNAVAAGLVGTNTALGVLPLGTLNHFAKDIGIPLKLEEAVRNIFTGRTINVDVGEVNGRVFLNNSSIGLYPQIVRQREEGQSRGYHKWVAFAQAVASVLRRHSRLHVRLDLDGKAELERATTFVFVGNNRYEIAGLDIGGRKTLAGGRLWVCISRHAGRSNLLLMALRALLGRLTDGDLDAIDAKEIGILTKRDRVDVSTDGEVNVMDSPLHYRCRPRALRVIVPAGNGEQA
jgi:diacylglycerol kinase family enzyme